MSRALLQIVLPLVLPTLLYILWAVFIRKPGQNNGDTNAFAWVQQGPWLWLIAAGVVLMGIGLTATALLTGADPGGVYVPARLEDGRVVPSRIE
jgi:hypothetical protein